MMVVRFLALPAGIDDAGDGRVRGRVFGIVEKAVFAAQHAFGWALREGFVPLAQGRIASRTQGGFTSQFAQPIAA